MKIDRAELSRHCRSATRDDAGARTCPAHAAWLLIALLAPAALAAEVSIASASADEAGGYTEVVPAPDPVAQQPENSARQTGETARNEDPFIADDIRGAALVYASAIAPASNYRASVS